MGAKTGAAPAIRHLYERYPEMSQAAIARKVGCTSSTVSTVLKQYLNSTSEEELRQFQENKADIYDAIQHRALSTITNSKLRNASAQSLVTAAAILEDKARLVRGQATNINATILLDVVEMLKNRNQ